MFLLCAKLLGLIVWPYLLRKVLRNPVLQCHEKVPHLMHNCECIIFPLWLLTRLFEGTSWPTHQIIAAYWIQ